MQSFLTEKTRLEKIISQVQVCLKRQDSLVSHELCQEAETSFIFFGFILPQGLKLTGLRWIVAEL